MRTITSSNKKVQKQKGLVLVMVTMAMLVFVAIAALSIDINHLMVNKTRLQNAVDSAALSAAVLIDSDSSIADATAAANTTFTNMAGAVGNSEMDMSTANVSVTYSNDPQTFPDSSFDSSLDVYVRVEVTSLDMDEFFIQAFGLQKTVSASAVAGPSSASIKACNIVPMSVCSGGGTSTDGYERDELYMLKLASTSQGTMGPGNYQLLDFGSGASTIRSALAGGYDGCITIGENIDTKPGGNVGPVGQGINSRFGVYSGGGLSSSDYPTDIYVKEPSTLATADNSGNITYNDTSGAGGDPWGYSDYMASTPDCSGESDCRIGSGGVADRRILPVPVVDCSTASGGTSNVKVTAIGCFFLLQQAPTNNGSHEGVFGEFIEDCTVDHSNSGPTPEDEGPYRIQLYKDPLSTES